MTGRSLLVELPSLDVSDTRSLGVLREREFALFFWGQAVSVLGDGIFPIALAFAVLELGGSPTDLGIVLIGGHPAAGALRADRRRLGRPAAAAHDHARLRCGAGRHPGGDGGLAAERARADLAPRRALRPQRERAGVLHAGGDRARAAGHARGPSPGGQRAARDHAQPRLRRRRGARRRVREPRLDGRRRRARRVHVPGQRRVPVGRERRARRRGRRRRASCRSCARASRRCAGTAGSGSGC